MDGAAFEEEIGDIIQKGGRARKFEAMGHGCACFQAVLGEKKIVKCFMQRGKDTCVWGYCGRIVLWRVVDRRYGARKWWWIFSVGRREVAEEEVYPYYLVCQNFA